MGELQFAGASQVERDSGVWIDGQYVGYLKELKDEKKVMLLPGEHEIGVRQAGYKDFTQTMLIEPGTVHTLAVSMSKDPRAVFPDGSAAELKLNVKPERAAVFVDDGYVGHAGHFGGVFNSMLLSPGKHRIKVALPGYRTFETEVSLLPGQKSEVKAELPKGSIEQAEPLIKKP